MRPVPPPQGLPFCVAGVGDLLALFRCISCRYCFGTDAATPAMLGAPGRVFTTSEVRHRPFKAYIQSANPASASMYNCSAGALLRFGALLGHQHVAGGKRQTPRATVRSLCRHPVIALPHAALADDKKDLTPCSLPPPQPEMSRNVQKYSREIYARASEAMHCRVHATLMLPLFTEPARRNVVGILEVVQVHIEGDGAVGMTETDKSYSKVVTQQR